MSIFQIRSPVLDIKDTNFPETFKNQFLLKSIVFFYSLGYETFDLKAIITVLLKIQQCMWRELCIRYLSGKKYSKAFFFETK